MAPNLVTAIKAEILRRVNEIVRKKDQKIEKLKREDKAINLLHGGR